MSDDEHLVTDDPISWPTLGTYHEKAQAIAHIRARDLSPQQAAALRQALGHEENEYWTGELLTAVLAAEGRQGQKHSELHYELEDIVGVYEDALASAQTTAARVALHRTLVRFLGQYSTNDWPVLRDFIRGKISESNEDDAKVILEALQGIIEVDLDRRLELANVWLDNPQRPPTDTEVEEWARIVAQTIQGRLYWTHRIETDAAERLSRALRRHRFNDKTLIIILDLLCCRFYREATCEPVFLEYSRHHIPEVRVAAIHGLAKCKQFQTLRDVLTNDGTFIVLNAAWNALGGAYSIVERTHILVTNPNVEPSASLVLSKLLASGNVLRQVWPFLPAHFRDALERAHRQESYQKFFGDPEIWHRWHEREQATPAESLVGTGIFAWMMRPLHEQLELYDLESVTSLRRVDAVEMRDEEVLRFGFLADAGILHDRYLRSSLERFDLDALLEREKEFDAGRDRVASLRRDLAEIAREIGQHAHDEVRRMRKEARDQRESDDIAWLSEDARRFVETERALKYLQLNNNERGGWYIREASEKMLPLLREMNVPMIGMVAPDGILGEYQPTDRSVTLFGPMLELGALDVARQLACSSTEVWPIVRSIVEIHELAHAQMHLGQDADGRGWHTPDAATIGFHEAFAQLYTRKVVAKQKVERASEVLRIMEQWLPEEYRYADLLGKFDAEELRSYVVRRRTRAPGRTQADVLLGVLRGLDGHLRLVRGQLPEKAFRTLAEQIHRALVMTLKALEIPTTARVHAIDGFLDVIQSLPQAEDVLGVFVKGGWPSTEQRQWLLFEALVDGEPIGKGPLRYLRKKDIIKAASTSKSAAEIGLKPALRMSESAVAELCKFAGRDPNDEHFGVRRAPMKKTKIR